MSEKYTPEPWKIVEGDDWLSIGPTNGMKPLITDTPGWPECFVDDPQREAEARANARRIVATVNALAGIPTPALESGAVARLVAAALEAEAVLFEDGRDSAGWSLREALADFPTTPEARPQ